MTSMALERDISCSQDNRKVAISFVSYFKSFWYDKSWNPVFKTGALRCLWTTTCLDKKIIYPIDNNLFNLKIYLWIKIYHLWNSTRINLRPVIVSHLYKWYMSCFFFSKSYSICRWHKHFFSHKDPSCLLNIVNQEMSKFSQWLKVNKLSLNMDETKFILFKPRQKKMHKAFRIAIDDNKEIK